MSTFDGFIREIHWISIDRFEKNNAKNSTTYFLSHCHADHMNGIKNAEFISALYRHKDNYLYCSEITALILRNLGNQAIMNKVRTIKICCPTLISIPQIENEGCPQDVMVTLLPAGHCPGSTMFLFETANENILYTGDFRINEKDFCKFKHLHHKNGIVKDFSCIYLDTTFWNQSRGLFPSRDESLQLIINQIENWLLQHSDGHIHIDRPGRIGSEHLIIALSKKFKSRIHISKDSHCIYQGIYEIEEAVTLECTSSTKIHMCENFRPGAGNRYLRCTPSYYPVLHIRPTAQWYAHGGEFRPVKYDKSKSYVQISLSMHASRAELVAFLQYLKPRKAFACVVPENSSQEQIDEELREVLQENKTAYKETRLRNFSSYDGCMGVQNYIELGCEEEEIAASDCNTEECKLKFAVDKQFRSSKSILNMFVCPILNSPNTTNIDFYDDIGFKWDGEINCWISTENQSKKEEDEWNLQFSTPIPVSILVVLKEDENYPQLTCQINAASNAFDASMEDIRISAELEPRFNEKSFKISALVKSEDGTSNEMELISTEDTIFSACMHPTKRLGRHSIVCFAKRTQDIIFLTTQVSSIQVKKWPEVWPINDSVCNIIETTKPSAVTKNFVTSMEEFHSNSSNRDIYESSFNTTVDKKTNNTDEAAIILTMEDDFDISASNETIIETVPYFTARLDSTQITIFVVGAIILAELVFVVYKCNSTSKEIEQENSHLIAYSVTYKDDFEQRHNAMNYKYDDEEI